MSVRYVQDETPVLTAEERARYPIFRQALDTLALPGVKQTLVRNHRLEADHLAMGAAHGLRIGEGDRARLRCWVNPHNSLCIIATLPPKDEDKDPTRGQLHVSVSVAHRLPTWEEYKAVKEATFGPHLDAMQVLPRKELYYNFHPFCLHLWEMPVPWRIDQC